MNRNSSASFVAVLIGLMVNSPAVAEEMNQKALRTFVVHCYDVGARSLEQRPGIVSVKRGWHGAEEINTVTYDPQQVTVPQMESWLKEADTYVRTLSAGGEKEK